MLILKVQKQLLGHLPTLGDWCGVPLTSQAWDMTQENRKQQERPVMLLKATMVREPGLFQILCLILLLKIMSPSTSYIFHYWIPKLPFGEHWTTKVSFHGSGHWKHHCWLGKEDTPWCLLFAQIFSHFFLSPPWDKVADNNLVTCHVSV